MGKTRNNPFRGFMDMMSEMSRMRQLGETGYEAGQEGRTHATAWVPNADIFAIGRDLIIRAELAGVSREEIDIAFYNSVLTISGERNSELDEEKVSFYVRERYYGAFRRSMTLPAGISEGDISADFENGMLEITIRGGAAAEPRRIEIGDKSG